MNNFVVFVVEDAFVCVVLDFLATFVIWHFVTNFAKTLDDVDSVVVVREFSAFEKIGKSKNFSKGSNRAGKSENMSPEWFLMALLLSTEVGVEVDLVLARKALDLGNGCANLCFGTELLVVEPSGFFSCRGLAPSIGGRSSSACTLKYVFT